MAPIVQLMLYILRYMRSTYLGGEAGLEQSVASDSGHPGPVTILVLKPKPFAYKALRKEHFPVVCLAQACNLSRPSHIVGSGSKLYKRI